MLSHVNFETVRGDRYVIKQPSLTDGHIEEQHGKEHIYMTMDNKLEESQLKVKSLAFLSRTDLFM